MRIGIDMHYAQHPIAYYGIGNYSSPHIAHLSHHQEMEIFFFQPNYDDLSKEQYVIQLSQFIVENVLDILYFPSPMHVPFPEVIYTEPLPPVLMAAMVHDLIPSVYPEVYLQTADAKAKYEQHLQMIKQMDLILTNTHFTFKDLVRFNLDPDKIAVIGFGCNKDYYLMENVTFNDINLPFTLDNPYILAFSPEDFRKNVPRTIQAFALAIQGLQESFQLLIIGRINDHLRNQLSQLAIQSGVGNKVHFAGFVTKSELLRLLNGAHSVAFPTLYEGIGLPAIESMQCGAPLLTSSTSSMPEVVGDAAVLVDPENVESIAQGLQNLLTDTQLRKTLRERGFQQIRSMDWTAVTERAAAAFKNLLIKGGSSRLAQLTEAFIGYEQSITEIRQEINGVKQQLHQLQQEFEDYKTSRITRNKHHNEHSRNPTNRHKHKNNRLIKKRSRNRRRAKR
ncbi:MAG: glycosyltransferase family 4 protein [Candidatus Pristimantibacillus sp.]